MTILVTHENEIEIVSKTKKATENDEELLKFLDEEICVNHD